MSNNMFQKYNNLSYFILWASSFAIFSLCTNLQVWFLTLKNDFNTFNYPVSVSTESLKIWQIAYQNTFHLKFHKTAFLLFFRFIFKICAIKLLTHKYLSFTSPIYIEHSSFKFNTGRSGKIFFWDSHTKFLCVLNKNATFCYKIKYFFFLFWKWHALKNNVCQIFLFLKQFSFLYEWKLLFHIIS